MKPLTRKVAWLGLAGLVACQSPAEDGAETPAEGLEPCLDEPAPPAPAPWSFEVVRRGGDVAIRGSASTAFSGELEGAIAGLCELSSLSVSLNELAEVDVPLEDLPLDALTQLVCGADELNLKVSSTGKSITGEAGVWSRTERAALEETFASDAKPEGAAEAGAADDPGAPVEPAGDDALGGWSVKLTWRPEPDAIPAGYGRLRLTGDPQAAALTLEQAIDGEPVSESVTPAWAGLLKPGIYRLSNGDHIGVRDGLETRVLPGNTAALTIAGRRFPLDEALKVVGLDAPDSRSFQQAAVVEACERDAKRPCWSAGRGPAGTPTGLEELRAVVRQVILRHDGAPELATHWTGLVGEGHASHLGIDFDGAVHQGLDLVHTAHQAGQADALSVAIDLNNLGLNLVEKPDAAMHPDGHPRASEMANHPRERSEVRQMAGVKVQTFGYTEAQWKALLSVGRLLVRVFPAVAPTAPKDETGKPKLDRLARPRAFSGFLGLHAWDAERWEPGPALDWTRLEAGLKP
jgi:hypothetical protein